MKARYCTTSEHEIRQAVKQYVDEQRDAIEDEYLLMDSPKHYDYSPRNVQAFLKERYGIDFNESQYGTNQEGGSK